MNTILSLLPLLLPLALIQFGLQIYCFIDLRRRPSVRFGNKWIWFFIILFGNLLGSVLYLVLREETPQ